MSDDDGPAGYFRRRADAALDRHLSRMEQRLDEIDAKVDKLVLRVGIIAAGFGLVLVVTNIVGPIIAARIILGT